MKKSQIQYDMVAGIDVSKDWFDAALGSDGEEIRFDRSGKGIKKLVKRLSVIEGKILIVTEATGGLERKLVKGFVQAGYTVAVINPRQIRDFAKASGQSAKTDKIDARIIALFGERMDVHPTVLPSEQEEELQALVRRRNDLVDMIVAEKNRLSSTDDSAIAKQIGKHLRWLERDKARLEEKIRLICESNRELKEKREIIESMIGVGEVTSAVLLTELPELGRLKAKEISKLVGVAPLNDISGKRCGKARIFGGRVNVRNALYMPALNGKRFNPVLRVFYKRLLANGKENKEAIVAVMRKMLVILNAMVRDGKKFSTTTA